MTGTAEFNGGGTAGATLLIFSTEGAQELFLGGRDVFTSVALTAAPGVTQQQLVDAAEHVLPASYEAVEGRHGRRRRRRPRSGEFLDVITQFLIAFAVIAILVGGFIIANTFNILVAQRVRELALLRALGASARAGAPLGAARGGADGPDRLLDRDRASGCCWRGRWRRSSATFGLDITPVRLT